MCAGAANFIRKYRRCEGIPMESSKAFFQNQPIVALLWLLDQVADEREVGWQ